MNRLLVFIFFCFLFSGCSTVEKRGYFTPEVDSNLTAGPEKPFCGFANFDGMPDQYVSLVGEHKITVKAYQYYHPYMWGPWFVSIVPIFPITWVAEAFINDDLKVEVFVSNEAYIAKGIDSYFISYEENGKKVVKPYSVSIQQTITYIVFPVDSDKLEKFVFHMVGFKYSVDIPFSKATRWSWTQWTPNC